jgi:hypothetical protein
MAFLNGNDKILHRPPQGTKVTVTFEMVQHAGVVLETDQEIPHEHTVKRFSNGAQQFSSDLGLNHQGSLR